MQIYNLNSLWKHGYKYKTWKWQKTHIFNLPNKMEEFFIKISNKVHTLQKKSEKKLKTT